MTVTNGRKNFVRIVFISLCFCPAVTTQADTLNELIEQQEAALSALEKKPGGAQALCAGEDSP